ncbi:MAG: type II secretion system protein J [Chthoniobacteraceae bacterium]
MRWKGFTLIELLVGMGILAMLVVLLGQMLAQVEGAWSTAESNKERLQNMRAISDFIANELQAALLPVNRTGTNSLQFVVNDATIPSAYQNRDAIFWQTPLASDQTLGDVAEVGYFVKWDGLTPKLCRFFVSSGKTTSGIVSSNTNFLIYSKPSKWLSQTTIDAVAPANQANSYEGMFAENVLGFWVQCLDSTGVQITSDTNGAAFSNDTFDSRRGYTDSGVTRQLPAIVNLSFAIIDSRSAKKITASLQSELSSLVTSSSNAQSFVTSVQKQSKFQAISQGIRSWQTAVYIQNSK